MALLPIGGRCVDYHLIQVQYAVSIQSNLQVLSFGIRWQIDRVIFQWLLALPDLFPLFSILRDPKCQVFVRKRSVASILNGDMPHLAGLLKSNDHCGLDVSGSGEERQTPVARIDCTQKKPRVL